MQKVIHRQPFQLAMASRVANTATPEKVAKVLRGARPAGPNPKELATTDMDKLVESHLELMADLLKATPRPTSTLLKKSALLAWRCDAHEADLFASRMVAAFKYCRGKRNGATTFKKVHKAVGTIAMMMKPTSTRSATVSPKKKAHCQSPTKADRHGKSPKQARRDLKRTRSDTVSPKAVRSLTRTRSDTVSPKAGRTLKKPRSDEAVSKVELPVMASSSSDLGGGRLAELRWLYGLQPAKTVCP